MVSGIFYEDDAFMSEFGRIVHLFAVCEVDIKLAIAAMSEISPTIAGVLGEPYGAQNVKNVASSIAKLRLDPSLQEEFSGIIGEIFSFSKLRNQIAHNRWIPGKRRNSFKPMRVNIRNNKAEFIGLDDEERDYTAKELNAEYQRLYKFDCKLIDFMEKSGLFEITLRRSEEQKHVLIGAKGS